MVIYLLGENHMYLPPLFLRGFLRHFFGMGWGMGGLTLFRSQRNCTQTNKHDKQR